MSSSTQQSLIAQVESDGADGTLQCCLMVHGGELIAACSLTTYITT